MHSRDMARTWKMAVRTHSAQPTQHFFSWRQCSWAPSSSIPFDTPVIKCKDDSDIMTVPTVYFLLKEHPSVNLALPPVGVHNTEAHPSQVTAV